MCSALLDVPRVVPQRARAAAASQNVLLQPSMITQTQPVDAAFVSSRADY